MRKKPILVRSKLNPVQFYSGSILNLCVLRKGDGKFAWWSTLILCHNYILFIKINNYMYQVLYGVFFDRNRHDQLPSICPCLHSGDLNLPRVFQVSLRLYITVSYYTYVLFFVKYLDGALTWEPQPQVDNHFYVLNGE